MAEKMTMIEIPSSYMFTIFRKSMSSCSVKNKPAFVLALYNVFLGRFNFYLYKLISKHSLEIVASDVIPLFSETSPSAGT